MENNNYNDYNANNGGYNSYNNNNNGYYNGGYNNGGYNNGGYNNYNGDVPGKGAATASMVLGIISVVLWFFGYSAIVSVILGVVGLILAGNAKKAGFMGGIRTAGFVLSLIGLIGGALVFIACVAVVGAIGTLGLYY
ncbi:MAG TPA: hypothetical protein IAC18_08750 [Candidatus Scatomorpha merdipullorum]|uniref:DUF4190 domain-containing protein n=1 Tax=Candidatus Scatomorpha merdipullorum TaxID=2840927 RepID=A0A9D1JVX5_9FIRM|nr:hypothetical protein [Candidatus Scatomorpha merdipullorum]